MFGQRQVSLAVSMLAWLQMFWLLKPCLWELTCLTSDAALETYWFGYLQSLRNHRASCLAEGVSDTHLPVQLCLVESEFLLSEFLLLLLSN